MPEIISDKKVFSLLEVTLSIQKTLSERYKSSFWIKAEMNKLNHYSHSGHCYPELVEKRDGKVIAQMKSILWKDDFYRINRRFLEILKEPVKDGIEILFCAAITFDASHGLSLRIIDIDPVFSLGELEREKQETIDKLTKEGIFHNNKKLTLALLPQRIAVISVETSKGYADYLKVIKHNPWGYKFFNFLFPSLLQGDRSIASIINQLKRIKKVVKHFDAVAIIRGGGGDVGLSSYNNYELAREIVLFPLPVITGIGHSTNETVVEMVSYKNSITPTELADFLIQKFHNFSVPVRKAEEIIVDKARRMLKEEKLKFRNAVRYFQSVTNNRLLKSHNTIQNLSGTVIQQSKFLIRQESQSLDLMSESIKKYPFELLQDKEQRIIEVTGKIQKQTTAFLDAQKISILNLEKTVSILDPINILRRGFTITLHNGKAIKQSSEVNIGDTVTTVLADGQIVSTVTDSKKSD
jgi:exodeoxyribonuclease VII large subunit